MLETIMVLLYLCEAQILERLNYSDVNQSSASSPY